MEIVFAIREADEAIQSVTLGQLCAAGVVSLDVACYRCSRKGRYRLTRLIGHHGAGQGLPAFKDVLTVDCPRRGRTGSYDDCGAYFPRLAALKKKGE